MASELVERFDGKSRRAQQIFVAALLVMAAGLGTLVTAVPDDDLTGTARLWVTVPLVMPFAAASWMFSRMRLELQIDDGGFTARVRPFRGQRVDARTVVSAEIVEVEPFWEFGGWWHKGLRSNRLLGGTGSTALRVTYVHQVGAREPKTCRLTLLTAHAGHLLDALQRGTPNRA
ncbi:hypothetical protein [Candidatus Poriferisodalis sp.]|uniref:hypothetical protein n=1 Tax=Candidatus Poriferisodalis sp. TaxID=3101277 RepID=UPI003B0193C2